MQGLILVISAAFGNTATCLGPYATKKGIYAVAAGSWGGRLESGRLRHGDGAHGRGDRATGGHGPQGIPVQFPDSHSIPTSISSEFPRIDVTGRALGKDEKDPAIQTTSTSKMRRVDFGGCGPPRRS